MNAGNCLYIYRQLADGNGRGNCKLLYIAENCYIQYSQLVGRLLYTAGRYSWQVDTPATPPTDAQNLHGAYLAGTNPR